MNLKAIVQSARDLAFEVTKSVEVLGTYHSVTVGSYSVATGTTTQTTTTYSISARVGVFDRKEMDGNTIKVGDQKWIITRAELTAVPKTEDYIVDASGARWDISLIQAECSESIYVFRARKLVT